MIEVELDIYSGRPNPRWALSKRDASSFLDRATAKDAPLRSVTEGAGRLGYAGFLIRASGVEAAILRAHGIPSVFRVSEALGGGYGSDTEIALATSGAESLQTTGTEGDFWEAVSLLDGGAVKPRGIDLPAECRIFGTPWNDFSPWNHPAVVTENNCYNYASNSRTNTYAQPGRRSGVQVQPPFTVGRVRENILDDGYQETCNGDKLKVAMVIKPNTATPGNPDNSDFHFYRRNINDAGDNRWCHKRGGTPATNRDLQGDYITNPRNAARGAYTIWGGDFFSPIPHANVS